MTQTKKETVGINESMGRKESELLSVLKGETIVISAVEFTSFTNGKNPDGTPNVIEQALITIEGKDMIYRSSGKAVMDTLKKISDVLRTQSVRATVTSVKSKGSKYSYVALVEPKEE